MRFISKYEVLKDKKLIYASIVYNYELLKDKQFQVYVTIREDKLYYDENIDSLVSNLLETKNLLNSTRSNSKKELDLYA